MLLNGRRLCVDLTKFLGGVIRHVVAQSICNELEPMATLSMAAYPGSIVLDKTTKSKTKTTVFLGGGNPK